MTVTTCFKLKDTNKVKGKVTADLDFPSVQPPVSVAGCTVNEAESLVCLQTVKNGGDDPRGTALGATAYLCYKVVCPKGAFSPEVQSFHVITQFGDHAIAARDLVSSGARIICAPATLLFGSPS